MSEETTDYSFMEGISVEDYQKPEMVSDGETVELQIVSLRPNAEWRNISVGLKPVNTELAMPAVCYHTVWFPKPDDDADKKNRTLGALKAFYEAFGITDGSSPDTWMDATGSAIMKVNPDEGYGEQNAVKKFVRN